MKATTKSRLVWDFCFSFEKSVKEVLINTYAWYYSSNYSTAETGIITRGVLDIKNFRISY